MKQMHAEILRHLIVRGAQDRYRLVRALHYSEDAISAALQAMKRKGHVQHDGSWFATWDGRRAINEFDQREPQR